MKEGGREGGEKEVPREAGGKPCSSCPFLFLTLQTMPEVFLSAYFKHRATSTNLLTFPPKPFTSSDTSLIGITWRSSQQYLLFKLKYLVWNLSWHGHNALL